MNGLQRIALVCLLAGAAFCCDAGKPDAAYAREDVDAHVLAQFAVYGPLSKQHEYFGYVYLGDGALASAVVRGSQCSMRICAVDSTAAARLIPRGARVLGEWHTHPHRGSSQLSEEDVRGAHSNLHIRGYVAYYSKPNGDILAWDPREDRVPDAMASAVRIGNYRNPEPAVARGLGYAAVVGYR
jgi:hypothetical protein